MVSRAGGGPIVWRRVDTIRALFEGMRPAVVAIDVPIGLLERGARECDAEARRLLGVRRSSVFPAPIRPMLVARSHAEASQIRHRLEDKRVSIQTWGILPKIAEVDRFLRASPGRRDVLREAHPEVSFFLLNGRRPMSHPKRTARGQAERLRALGRWSGRAAQDALAERADLGCQSDDIVDAFAALWTAERIHAGTAISIPGTPPRDAHGLRMEMMA